MSDYCSMKPLYLFGIYCVNLLILQNFVQARIIIVDSYEKSVDDFPNRYATLFSGEIDGYMEASFPPDACTEIHPPTFPENYTLNKIVLINGTAECNFMTKVQNARSAGYDAALLFDPYPGLFDYPNLTFPLDESKVNLSVFLISFDDAIRIDKFLYYNSSDKEKFIVKIFTGMNVREHFYVMCIFVVIYIILRAIWECLKCCVKASINCNAASNNASNPHLSDHLDVIRNEFRNMDLIIASMFEQNSTTVLRKLERTFPSTEFSQEDDSFQTCVICCNNFQIGERIRVLGCFHVYHTTCIDEWFVAENFFLTCPLCKQAFRLESSSEPSFLDSTESTPLLNSTNGLPTTSGGGDNSSSASDSMYCTPVGSANEYHGFLAGATGSVNSA